MALQEVLATKSETDTTDDACALAQCRGPKIIRTHRPLLGLLCPQPMRGGRAAHLVPVRHQILKHQIPVLLKKYLAALAVPNAIRGWE